MIPRRFSKSPRRHAPHVWPSPRREPSAEALGGSAERLLRSSDVEADYIRQYKNDDNYDCVNVAIPGRTDEQYY